MTDRTIAAALAVASLLFLAACGGGGGGSATVPVTGAPPAQPPPPADPPPPIPTSVAGASATVHTLPSWRVVGSKFFIVTDDARFPGRHEGRRTYYDHEGWGLSVAGFEGRFYETDHIPDAEKEYMIEMSGTPTGTNPISGTATWLGLVRAAVAHPVDHGKPVEGHAKITADLTAATVDVDFTGFTHGHRDMAWRDLRVTNGSFSHRSGYSSISGAFYGTGHAGVAGQFSRDRLDGIFGAARQ